MKGAGAVPGDAQGTLRLKVLEGVRGLWDCMWGTGELWD